MFASDMIMEAIMRRAQEVLAPFKEPSKGLPDPSFTLQLPDEVYSGSNLYAVQKSFQGEFQFDIFFDSASAKQKISGQ
jgi:mannosyl-oligosaccharide glucosidase